MKNSLKQKSNYQRRYGQSVMKRFIATVLCFMLIITLMPVRANAEENTVTEWDGTGVEPSQLTTIDGIFYYQISKPEELAYIASLRAF
jgi:hypothetical protein